MYIVYIFYDICFWNTNLQINVCKLLTSYIMLQYARVHLLDTEPFENTFGKQSRRKKPTLKVADVKVSGSNSKYVNGCSRVNCCFSHCMNV